ncbi:uncharacterized protein LOC121695773 [Alosa sapidissima]|uniref:uncharacterized protein LOC121695773 n=1 Tax=Alosa sapidissima TaxID=34773 RepID=UPI001C093D6D|nr:uncharacterized protein LOC121695773 [Alosa sapidissima]
MMSCRLMMLFFSLIQVDPSFIVTQSPDVAVVASGGSATLQCDIAELYSWCSHVVWLKLDRRRPMMLQVTDRIKMVNPNDGMDGSWVNVCRATLPEVTIDDAGMYYCVLSQGRFAHVGNGTRLMVTESNSTFPSPSIEIISPMAYTSIVPLLCLVSGISPSQAHVFWVISGRVESGWTDSDLEDVGECEPLKRLTRNQVLVPVEEWERGVQCACVVEVAGLSFNKTLQRDGITAGGSLGLSRDHCFAVYYIYSVVWVTSTLMLLLLGGTTAVCLIKNAAQGFLIPQE